MRARSVATELNVPQLTIWRILRQNNWHPYSTLAVQAQATIRLLKYLCNWRLNQEDSKLSFWELCFGRKNVVSSKTEQLITKITFLDWHKSQFYTWGSLPAAMIHKCMLCLFSKLLGLSNTVIHCLVTNFCTTFWIELFLTLRMNFPNARGFN